MYIDPGVLIVVALILLFFVATKLLKYKDPLPPEPWTKNRYVNSVLIKMWKEKAWKPEQHEAKIKDAWALAKQNPVGMKVDNLY